MASLMYNKAKSALADGSIVLTTATLKIMLVDDNYSANPDIDFVDTGGNDAEDPSFNEIVATNYAGGFSGAGRKATTATTQPNDTNDRGDVAFTDVTWTALGGATNDNIGGAILYKHDTSDAVSVPILFFDFATTPTNGSDVTIDFLTLGGGGNLRLQAA